jgi:hypothetical protein
MRYCCIRKQTERTTDKLFKLAETFGLYLHKNVFVSKLRERERERERERGGGEGRKEIN